MPSSRAKLAILLVASLLSLVAQCTPGYATVCTMETFKIENVSGIVAVPNWGPLQGAEVDVLKNGTETIGHALTDSDGGFYFPDIPSGKYDLRVRFVGFADGWAPIAVSRPKKANAKEKSLRILLEPAYPLGGCPSVTRIKK